MRGFDACSLLVFALLAVVQTWPLATSPARLSRNDNADTVLNEWIVAWVARQLPRDPAHLFDANIFYPDRHTLAYSEPLVAPAILGAPLLWIRASPVLVYNLLLLAGFTLTGWAACRLVHRWTGDRSAGLLSGIVVAFNAHTLTRLPHLQAIHGEFIPLALLAFDDLLHEPRARHAVRLAAWIALQGITSLYLLVFLTVALIVGFLARPEDWRSARGRAIVAWLAASAAIAAALVLPILWPYLNLHEIRPLDEVARYSATWRDYLATPARLHYARWSAPYFGGSAALFPGVASLALALVAIGRGTAFVDRRARMVLAAGLAGIALSFGPALPGYAWLYRWCLPLQGVRNAARFGYLAILGAGILAGFGWASVRSAINRPRWAIAAAVSVLVLANVDACAAPIEYVTPAGIPPLYTRLRRTSNAVVAEFPFFPPDHIFHNADYLFAAARHWRPMLNGYSGLVPASYVAHYEALRGFPDARSIAALRAAGVTHVIVHDEALRAWTDNAAADAVRRSPDLFLVEDDGSAALYALRPPAP